jgi:hypothetical protein
MEEKGRKEKEKKTFPFLFSSQFGKTQNWWERMERIKLATN